MSNEEENTEAIYSKEFRERTAKQVTDDGLSAKEAAQTAKLGEIDKTQRRAD